MNNKVLINLLVPELDLSYDLYLPVNKKIGRLISLLEKAINEINNTNIKFMYLYDSDTGECYKYDELLFNTKIRNGSVLVLIR